jgi:DNA replication protein DnaC
MSRADGTFLNYRERMIKTDILILDDLGIKPLPQSTVQDLYDILEERYQSKSTVITSQLPLKNWREVIDDPVALEAILDRLIHGAIKIELKGESYRKKRSTNLPSDQA